ncbi:MAG: D-alanyl-D-alanine carboxypeptidase [Maribacter sp.]|nr:D-alanyl-D-alanine carboxypeptidase [Maribacter sp.]
MGRLQKTISKFLILILLMGCAGTKKKFQKAIRPLLESEVFKNQFTGFLVLDQKTGDTLFNINSAKYFTPASNVKIFTLFTALQLLPKKIPALKYIEANDTLFIEGTGDPTFLHSYFKDSTVLKFLGSHQKIVLYLNNFQEEKYGPGWAWDDYGYYYQPERSGLPMYGNVGTIFRSDSLHVIPEYFRKNVVELGYSKSREEAQNLFYYGPKQTDTVEIPFRTDSTLTRILLEDVLHKKVHITNRFPEGTKSILYNVPADSVYRRMMQVSDNFLAEQLMILASTTLSDTLSFTRSRDFILENELSDLRQPARWVDASGLSRYNLITPQAMVSVLRKLYLRVPKERLFSFFPMGGVSGTLVDWYGGSTPYVYAKSGSLGNNYCLSGYLITKSGSTLIFSFMNNHFLVPPSEIKNQMQAIFEIIRDTF